MHDAPEEGQQKLEVILRPLAPEVPLQHPGAALIQAMALAAGR